MYGDRLVYADTQNNDKTVHPILGLSKTLTAVGILKLAEEGVLNLDWTVFGPGGILPEYTGPDGTISDPRVETIRIRHLLHHTGGWDETIGPIYDPMQNTQLVKSGVRVVDIKRELGLYDDAVPDQFDIITFMLGQPLQFEPGTRARESNFGFCVLGRVIEEVTSLPYDYWIQKNVLQPAGMWHTRIGPPPSSVSNTIKPPELNNSVY